MREWWDLAIIGAGVIGALVLDKFRQARPDASVLVIDRTRPAAGTTGSSAGVCVPIAGVPARVPLVGPSQAYFADHQEWRSDGLVRQLDVRFILRRHNLQTFLRAWQGKPPEQVAHIESVLDYVGDLRIERDELVIRSTADCFVVDAARLTRTLINTHLATSDTALWEGSEVVGIDAAPQGVHLRLSTGSCVNARAVAVATGGCPPPWPDPVLVGCPLKRIAALRADHPAGDQLPMIDFIEDDLFILPSPRKSLIVSFRRESYADMRSNPDISVTAEDIEEGRAALARRSQQLAASIVGAQTGYDGYPVDGAPVVTVGGGGRVVGVGGTGGSGVRLGPAVADRVVQSLPGAIGGNAHARKHGTASGIGVILP
jgi:hypothetical protein